MELRVKPMLGATERPAQDVVGLGSTGAGQALVSDARRGVDAWDVHARTKLKTWAQPPGSGLAAPAVYHAATKTLLAPAADGRVLVCDTAAPALVPTVQSERLPGAVWRVVPVAGCAERVAVVLRDGAVAACNVRTGAVALCAPSLAEEGASSSSSKKKKNATAATSGAAPAEVTVLAAGVAGDTLHVVADVAGAGGSEHALVVSAVAVGAGAAAWRARGVVVLERAPAAAACVAAALHGASQTLFAVRRDAVWRTHALAAAAWAPSLAAARAAAPAPVTGADAEAVRPGDGSRGSLACLACGGAPVAVAWAARDALLVAGTLTDVWQARRHVPPPGTRVVLVLETVFGTALCVRPLDAAAADKDSKDKDSKGKKSKKGKDKKDKSKDKDSSSSDGDGHTLHLLCLDAPEKQGAESKGDKPQKRQDEEGAVTAFVALDSALFGCEVRVAPVSLGDAIARGLPTSCQLDPPLSVMTDIIPRNAWSLAVEDELAEEEEDDDDDSSDSDDDEEGDARSRKGRRSKRHGAAAAAAEEGYLRTQPFVAAARAWPQTVGAPNAEELAAIAEIAAPATPAARVVERVRALLHVEDARDAPRLLRHLLLRARGGVPVRRAVSFHLVQAVAQRACSERDIRAVWRAVEPLLTCGVVTHCAAPRLLAACIEQQHLAGLELCLLCMKEIPDAAVVAVLRHVLALPDAPLAAFARAHPLLADAAARPGTSDAAAAELARDHLLTRVIVLPRNEVFAHKYVRQLSAVQVTAFLSFLAQWLDEIHGIPSSSATTPAATPADAKTTASSSSSSSEDAATAAAAAESTPLHTVACACGAAPTLRQVVRWTETLIDAHVSSLVLTPDSQGTLAHIAACLRGELALCQEMDTIQPLLAQLKLPATLPHEEIPPYQIEFISF